MIGKSRWAALHSAWTLRTSSALRVAVSSFLATRAVVLVSVLLGMRELPHTGSYSGGPVATLALMWDGAWYAGIAKFGYVLLPPPNATNLAFPPLMPLLARMVGKILRYLGLDAGNSDYGRFALAGLLISNAAFLLALYLLWQLVAIDHPAAVANRTLWLVAAFPLGVFWSLFYTEALFLLLAVSCLLAARRGAWLWAGVFGGLAALTRWAGVLLAIVLLVEWLMARWPRRTGPIDLAGRAGKPSVKALAAIAIVPLALAGYFAYLQGRFGRPLAMFESHRQGWHEELSYFPMTYVRGLRILWQHMVSSGPRQPGTPTIYEMVAAQGQGSTVYIWLDLGLPVLCAVLGLIGWRRGWLRPGDLAWLSLGLGFALSWNTTLSVGRYMMTLWPAMIVGARLWVRRPTGGYIWLAGAVVLLALTAYLFAEAKWIG